MPLGDSITEGWPDPDRVTYRFYLHKQLTQVGYDVDFVGTRTGVHSGTPLYTDWDQQHQAISGTTADFVASQITGWANTTQPDVVLLHIGTNDILQNQGVTSTANEVRQIIDNLRAARPNADIFLAKIIPSTINSGGIVEFNNQIPGIVAAKDTPQSRVILVDQFAGFDVNADEFDGIHPNLRGERKMAAKWYAALTASGLLPAPTNPPPPVTYLSDLTWQSMTNGFGPVERDRSNGESGAEDGRVLELNNASYLKGLGTHAGSEVVYNLSGNYARFLSSVGMDDEVGSGGSVVFRVFVDGVQRYDSGVMTGSTATKHLDVDVTGATTLRLVVDNAGDGNSSDHADWADARLRIAPRVTASNFAYATAPHALSSTFSRNVGASLGADDLLLENLTTGQTVPTGSISLSYNTGTNTARFTFPGFTGGVLPDGGYRATIRAAGVVDSSGNPMLADHVHNFVFLIGDANNDGTVNLGDFNVLASNFGESNRNFTHGDFNYDGTVNLTDFNILASRFGNAALPPAFRSAGGGAWARIRDVADDERDTVLG
jgi:lysophospholipase L1-like esterase